MIPNRTILTHSNRIFFSTEIILLILLVQALFIACNSDSTLIGESLQPPSERIHAHVLDNAPIQAFTLTQDSILSSGALLATVGHVEDDYFGSTSARCLFRVRLGASIFAPGPYAMADSLVLTLLPDAFYGDSATKMILKVYRLAEDIFFESDYYSNLIPEFDEATEYSDTIAVTDTLIRFMLDTAFFVPVLQDIDTVNDNAELRENFKGIYVTIDPVPVEGEGAILLLNLLSSDSKMTLYYRTPTDTLKYDFLISSTSARVNMFSHDHSSGPSGPIDMDTTGTVDTTWIYVQGLAGTYARIDFPSLDDLNELGDLAINKAEITFKVFNYADTAVYPPPDALTLYTLNEEDEYTILLDNQLGEEYFGGTLDEEEGEYSFTITNHIKDYLYGRIPHSSLYLFVGNQVTSPERVILFNNDSTNNIRFRIIYTLL
jgi:hypothetical protein